MSSQVLGHLVLYLDKMIFSLLLVLVMGCTAAVLGTRHSSVPEGNAEPQDRKYSSMVNSSGTVLVV